MIWRLFFVFLVLWLVGLATSYTLGGFIWILLVLAVSVALIQLVAGRRTV